MLSAAWYSLAVSCSQKASYSTPAYNCPICSKNPDAFWELTHFLSDWDFVYTEKRYLKWLKIHWRCENIFSYIYYIFCNFNGPEIENWEVISHLVQYGLLYLLKNDCSLKRLQHRAKEAKWSFDHPSLHN